MDNDDVFIMDGSTLVKYNGEGGDVIIPNGVTVIGADAFAENEAITSVTFADSVEKIGLNAFWWCSGIREIRFGKNSNLKTLCRGSFNGAGVTHLILPDRLQTIDGAFECCQELVGAVLPEGLREIKNWAFDSCEKLTQINIPSTVTLIGENAFSLCESLERIELPESLTVLGGYAFWHCKALKELIIPPKTREINFLSLGYCPNLKRLYLPASLQYINEDAFSDNPALTDIYYGGTMAAWRRLAVGVKFRKFTYEYKFTDGKWEVYEGRRKYKTPVLPITVHCRDGEITI